MPTLMRLLSFLALLGALYFAVIFSLATFVQPKQAEMTIRIPAEKINPPTPPAGS